MTDIPDMQDTELSPAIDELVALLMKLDAIAPDWRKLEVIKNGQGEAIMVIFDGTDEILLNGSAGDQGR